MASPLLLLSFPPNHEAVFLCISFHSSVDPLTPPPLPLRRVFPLHFVLRSPPFLLFSFPGLSLPFPFSCLFLLLPATMSNVSLSSASSISGSVAVSSSPSSSAAPIFDQLGVTQNPPPSSSGASGISLSRSNGGRNHKPGPGGRSNGVLSTPSRSTTGVAEEEGEEEETATGLEAEEAEEEGTAGIVKEIKEK